MLPQIEYAIYDVEIPSLKKKIKIRPYRVKEEKILLLARESNKTEEMANAIFQIVQNCIVDDIDVNKLATFDIDYLLLRLRGISGGETIELRYPIDCDDPKCEKIGHAIVNLKDIELSSPPPKIPKLQLGKNVIVTFRYPTMRDMLEAVKIEDKTTSIMSLIARCLDQIVDGENVIHPEDYTLNELQDWVDTFPKETFESIGEFFNNLPVVQIKTVFKCKKCSKKSDEITVKGIESFFV